MPNLASNHVHLGLEAILIKLLNITICILPSYSVLLSSNFPQTYRLYTTCFNTIPIVNAHTKTNNGFNVKKKLHSSLNKTNKNYGLSAVK